MPAFFSTSSLIGREVSNLQGEKLGLLEDFMIDTDRGEVQYAVLSFGGFLGVGNKLFAVPMQAMELDTEHEGFVLDIDKSRLENAPGFAKDDWPDMADPAFEESLRGYYGTGGRRH
jgi:sporulation protein YlmC with PRC-barrel domain